MTLTFICINTVATSQQSMTQKIEGGKWRQKWKFCRKFMDDFFFFFSHKKSGHIKNVQKEGIGKKEKRVQARSRSLTQKLGRERPH